MKKLGLLLMLLLAMTMQSHRVFAQSVTITLMPGWNWISVPLMDTLDFETAMGSFTPVMGDLIKSRWGQAIYTNNHWMGSISQFYPGYGYMYKSNRTMPVFLTFNAQQPAPQVIVTTAEPTNITANSATCGGNVASSDGNYVFVILRGICWSTNPNPTFNDNYVEAGNGIGSFSASMTELNPHTTYYMRAFAVTPTGTFYGEEMDFTTDYEYVDLGLPSGTLWATCNVGANTPEDYGECFAWGETETKDTYNWSTYQYCNGSYKTLTKYCTKSSYGYNGFTDNLITLLPEDDAATVNWGSNWRMPTNEEFQELYNNTTVTRTTQNGVSGRLFTASNGNSLFLPAAGYCEGSSLYGAGSDGHYWQSLLNWGQSCAAWYFVFDSDYTNVNYYGYRCYGRSVRAVRSGSQNPSFFIIDATANPSEGGRISGGGLFQEGTECTLTATPNENYTFANWTENDEVVSTDATYTFTVSAFRTLVANFSINFPTGAINGLFSVSASQQVYFSKGNLQYHFYTNTWRFATNQYDYVGSDNSSTNGRKDLFGWGTSGYNHGANCYLPWSTSETASDYYAYGSYTYNLYEQTGQADWGYNAISNGGNITHQWRTLTQPEWDYVFNTRSTISGIRYAKAQVNNVKGVILLPDDWDTGTYSLSNTNNDEASYSSNTISASQWSTLEQAGAVFLPAAGYRFGTSLHNVGSVGNYWSASCYDSDFACSMCFNAWNLYTSNNSIYRSVGFSVRLVCPAE